MAKMKIKESPVEETAPAPMIIFSEQEVLKLVDFINYMYTNAKHNLDMKEAGRVREMYNDMHAHVKKVEGYILEHKRTTQKKAE